MQAKMQSCLRSACFLCSVLVLMVGTAFPFFDRGNVWQQYYPPSDHLFSLSSGNVWQQVPISDSSASIYTGDAWQQWSSLDSFSSAQSDKTQTFPHHEVCSYCEELVIRCNQENICPFFEPCSTVKHSYSQHVYFGNGRSRGRYECLLFTNSIWTEVCKFCKKLAKDIGLSSRNCSAYCPWPFVPNN